MNQVEKQAISVVLQALLDAAAANKAKVITFLESKNTTVESLIQSSAAKISPIAGAVAGALGPEIIAYLGSEENAVFALLVADVAGYQASLGVELPTPIATPTTSAKAA